MCHKEIIHKGKYGEKNCSRAIKHGIMCYSCGQKKNPNKYWKGKTRSDATKLKISQKQIGRVISEITKKKMSKGTIENWKVDCVRQKRLNNTKWKNVKLDRGQLELLEKWNKLGFNFETNYQFKTDNFLCYIDGYDKEKNVVLKYDSKYHNRKQQIEKDLVRQQKIIDILKPKKFWRYNIINKTWKNVCEEEN